MGDLLKIIGGGLAGPFFLLFGLFILIKMLMMMNVNFQPVVAVMIALTPIWLPYTIFFILYEQWFYFVRLKFAINQGRSTLRIHLPQEVFKSPEAMESVLAQIHNVNSPDNLMQSWIDGKYPLVFSLELVSIGGEVRFYINVPTKKTKNAVEAQLYANYPGIEVTDESHDYTDEITWDPKRYEYMSFHMGKKDSEIMPIRTYIDFGMDKLPKEEEKFEPIAAMLEQLSQAAPHERIWVQFLCIPHTKKTFKNGNIHEMPTWEAAAKAKINEMLKRDQGPSAGSEELFERVPLLTMNERDTIAAIERNVSKYAYEVLIRWMYITEKGKFNGDFISPMIRSFAQYDVIGRNGIGVRWRTDFDYNWISDRSGSKRLALKKRELYDHKSRSFHLDYKNKINGNPIDAPKVFSVEELATIFHIPGSSVMTPTLPRIMSTRKEAPANLPTGQAVRI